MARNENSVGVKDRYCYLYGSRENIQEKLNIDTNSVIKEIEKINSMILDVVVG